MTIEFHCPNCRQSLRVPEEAAGKNGKCPQCATIFVVPSASNLSSSPPADPGPQRNPFADDPVVNPYDVGGVPAREYLPPGFQQSLSSELPVMPQAVDAGVIISFSFTLWQRHLGLLVGTTVVTALIMGSLGIGELILIGSLFEFDELGMGLTYHLIQDGCRLFNLAVQTFFFIGQVQIGLKLGRNQPAEFADLFMGGDRFFPTLAAWLVVLTPVYGFHYLMLYFLSWNNSFGDVEFGILLGYMSLYFLISIIFSLLFWPFLYLVIDRKASVWHCFSVALRVTNGNRWTTVLLALVSLLIGVVGYLACIVGLIFALPLMFILWTNAYLMMAGQIPSYNWLGQQSVYR